ncbi:MAG TPA: L-histidine N(alpha)-methyltransferase [Nitrososphaeraceae archaeon]|nr:L-histidine N(alpha)-methyltransferase [Nitrososphaeraceae archaeon]
MLIHNNERFIINNEFGKEVARGLNDKQKHISPKFFYDKMGSKLFEEICMQPEYYLNRIESQILKNSVDEILKIIGGQEISVIELGNGNSLKTRILLEPFLAKLKRVSYFPIDVSLKMLKKSIRDLFREYVNLQIYGVCSDYVSGLVKINEFIKLKKKIPNKKFIIFLGSSIGNFDPKDAMGFLHSIARYVRKEDLLLIGIDLEKDKSILDRAYNDKNGITAKFNFNVLARINRELDGEFNISKFEHKSFYNTRKHRIEMHLESKLDQQVRIGAIGKIFYFKKGETIHTENSYKYSLSRFNSLVKKAGLQVIRNFTDPNKQFTLILLKKVPNATKS